MNLNAQAVDTIVDERDGNTYPIAKVDTLWWFTENLRYATADSYFPNFNKKKEQIASGNFYFNNRLATACPEGWRIPTAEEWAIAVAKIFQTDKIRREKVAHNTSLIYQFDKPDSLNFRKANFLNIKRYGWVQGNKFNYQGGTTYWLNEANDPYLHLHFGLDGFSAHTHKHHIDDKPRKRRKFLIRCVCPNP
ncbi:MAG: FISUMP domain-containing protein [Bacteroidota bacterium]